MATTTLNGNDPDEPIKFGVVLLWIVAIFIVVLILRELMKIPKKNKRDARKIEALRRNYGTKK